MPIVHKSTIKRARQAVKRNQRNRIVLNTVKGIMKKVITAVEEKKADEAKTALREATAALSKAVTKGVLKPNTASRRVSGLATKVNTLTSVRT
ncbi:MAG: 30S ribosomal protein S20 [Nitrospirae bacterium]|nr:MAG: 30S ribosomal protein S20 [Nitrospirota bacterium]